MDMFLFYVERPKKVKKIYGAQGMEKKNFQLRCPGFIVGLCNTYNFITFF